MVAVALETRHIIHNFIDQSVIVLPDHFSFEDLTFWESQGFKLKNIPEKIIIATGSTRKLIMAYCLLNGFIFPNRIGDLAEQYDEGPLGLQALFKDKVHNGDGSYKEVEILVGVFHGVPVYGRSTDGEGPGNIALEEATNKVAHAYEYFYKGENVIVIAGDAVDEVTLAECKVLLGKPMNLPNFPKKEKYSSIEDYHVAVEFFLKAYVQIIFQEHQEIVHISGIAAIHGLTGELIELETLLKTTIPAHEGLQKISLDPGAGGGAGFQQFFDFEQFDDLSYEERLQWIWIIYCTIAGMPIYSMLGMVTDFGKQIKVWEKDEKTVEV